MPISRHAAWVPLLAASALLLAGCNLIPGLGGGGSNGNNNGGSNGGGSSESSASASPSGDSVDVFSIAVGDCLNDDSSVGEVSETIAIDCSDPHTEEIYSSVTVPEGDGTFPGDDALTQIVATQCVADFETFIGIAYDDSTLSITDFQPTQSSWDSGDREILCIVSDPAGPTTGSLQGAAY